MGVWQLFYRNLDSTWTLGLGGLWVMWHGIESRVYYLSKCLYYVCPITLLQSFYPLVEEIEG